MTSYVVLCRKCVDTLWYLSAPDSSLGHSPLTVAQFPQGCRILSLEELKVASVSPINPSSLPTREFIPLEVSAV